MNESCCLCKCVTELYFFYWLLLVVSLAILIAVPFVFSRSWTSHAGASTQNASRIKRFSRLHIVIKPLNKKKINIINSLLCWRVTLLMFTANLAVVKSENRLAVYKVILEIFWTFSLKAHDWSSWILTECNLSRKIVKYCILSEVCMINSTVSAQMWCIKSKNRLVYTPLDLLSRFCKVNLSKAKDSAWFVFQEFVFEVLNLLWSRAIMALECDRRLLLFFGCTYKAINSM